MLTVAPSIVLAALRDRGGIRIDDTCGMAGELRWLFDGHGGGIRRHYLRSDGMSIEAFAEWLVDRGFTSSRIDLRAAIDLLAQLFAPSPRKVARARVPAVVLDREALRARKNRSRKFACPECPTKCNGAASTFSGICGRCYRERQVIVFLVRCEETFDEVMTRQTGGAAESAPF